MIQKVHCKINKNSQYQWRIKRINKINWFVKKTTTNINSINALIKIHISILNLVPFFSFFFCFETLSSDKFVFVAVQFSFFYNSHWETWRRHRMCIGKRKERKKEVTCIEMSFHFHVEYGMFACAISNKLIARICF